MAGKGPKNFGRLGTGLRARVGRVKASRAATPRVNRAKAAVPGARVPNGAASGSARASSPLMPMTKTINKPKTGGRPSGRIPTRPRADGASRI